MSPLVNNANAAAEVSRQPTYIANARKLKHCFDEEMTSEDKEYALDVSVDLAVFVALVPLWGICVSQGGGGRNPCAGQLALA